MTGFVRNITVNTVTEALEEIRDLLVAQLWEVDAGSPTSFPFLLKSPEIINGYRPWIRYTNPSASVFRLQGDFDGTGASLSTARDTTVNSGSFIWVAADNEAMCQYVRPGSGANNAFHAGRLELLDPLDGKGIAVGELLNNGTAANYQEAEAYNSTAKWQQATSNHGLVANLYTGVNLNSGTLLVATNNKPIIASYFRFNTAFYRGDVKFAVSGLAGALAGTEFEFRNDTTNVLEKVYVSSGTGGFLVFDSSIV